MKKLLMIVFLCVMAMGVMAQDASFNDPELPKVELFAEQFDGKMYFIMKIKSEDRYSVKPITEIKIRFFDGTDVKWTGYSVGSRTKIDSGGVLIGDIVCVDNSTQTSNLIQFDLTDEQIEMLQKGVKMMTINTVPRVSRYEFPKDKIGKKLYEKFQKIRDLY